jgi:pimeloyl-ACP methyl ester carboxylesterase
MGGRTAMYLSLKWPHLVEKLAIVDVSPVNRTFDVTDATEWNMSHFFHAMKAVEFPQNTTISKARKDADSQLAKRISNPGLRAWLLMNIYEKSDSATVYFLAHFCPVAFFRQMIALKITLKKTPLLVLFLLAQKCLWTLRVQKCAKKIILF